MDTYLLAPVLMLTGIFIGALGASVGVLVALSVFAWSSELVASPLEGPRGNLSPVEDTAVSPSSHGVSNLLVAPDGISRSQETERRHIPASIRKRPNCLFCRLTPALRVLFSARARTRTGT